MKNIFNKIMLVAERVDKQRVYAKMVSDKITGPVKEKLQAEIEQLTIKLYGPR